LEGTFDYNTKRFKRETIERIKNYYLYIFEQVVLDINISIESIQLLSLEERNQLLYEFNSTTEDNWNGKTLHGLFEDQAKKNPAQCAVRSSIELDQVYSAFQSPGVEINPALFSEIEKCCFRMNKYIFQSGIETPGTLRPYMILKTHRRNSVVVNSNLMKVLELFDGFRNVKCIFDGIKNLKFNLLMYSISSEDILEITDQYSQREEIFMSGGFDDFVRVVKSLYNNHLVELVDVNSNEVSNGFREDITLDIVEEELEQDNKIVENLIKGNTCLSKADVLLLGDTTGLASVGLLYLASYLRRNGYRAVCQFRDTMRDYISLRRNITDLLEKIQPRIVGVSMKWFPHIARALEICSIVKEHSPHIKVVVGGDSASFYWNDIISRDCVDYVIRGEGEVPLLKICEGKDEIPNCAYKKNGQIIENPITYVQDDTNSSEIYLSHLDEVILSKHAPIFGMFFIHTQKGCGMSCFYCAGCRSTQKIVFNRKSAYQRRVEEVRKDIIEAKKHVSTFMFEFEAPNKDLFEYCREIWKDIDLSSHFCFFLTAYAPSPELIQLVNTTFKYVTWNPDFCSFSQRHRHQLFSMGLVKPQMTDDELISCFEEWEKYENCEVKINTISGLPFFKLEDIKYSESFIDKILSQYSSLTELHWGRLHAQPGAPITKDAAKYDMHSYAVDFTDFFKYSAMNLHQNATYPTFEYVNYPFIYFNDEDLNSKVTQHYVEMNQKLDRHIGEKRSRWVLYDRLSYGELNTKANKLACLLKEKGVTPGTIVGVMMPDNSKLIIALLGIFKAGAAYLPVDLDYPADRKSCIFEDSGLPFLLVDSNEESVVPPISNPLSVIPLDDKILTPYDGSNPKQEGSPFDLAYIIYTSGTTGKPNGVMIEHRGIVNFSLWRINAYRINEKDVTLQLLSNSFDAFGTGLYSTLLGGGTLAMIPGVKKLDFYYICQSVLYLGVSNISVVPGIYQTLLETAGKSDLRSLRFVVLGGEKCTPSFIRKSKEEVPHVLLINEYGPTETSITAIVNIGMNEFNTKVIGKPISNTRIFILDKSFNIVPIGVNGELCIAGVGVARGYLNNERLTQEKFKNIPSNFIEDTLTLENFYLSRIYCTGDIARWLPDGSIELVGRTDNQVKIRGHRIELGELEICFFNYPGIKEVVVVTNHELDTVIANRDSVEEHEDRQLCAYFTADRKLNIAELKIYLSGKLPDHMMPSYLIQLDEIPRTRNGKINRKALPDPRSLLESTYDPPQNHIQEILAKVWQEVLGLEKVGINDSFFNIGGDSIKVIQISSKLRQVGLRMEIKDIFEHPTIKKLEKYIKVTDRNVDSTLVEGEVPLTPIQKWFFEKNFLEHHHFNQSVMLYRRTGFDKELLGKVFKEVVTHHDALRMVFKTDNNHIVQQNRGIDGKLFTLEIIELDNNQNLNIEVEIEKKANEIQRSIDLKEGPLVHLGLFKTNDGDHLLIVIHHLVVDGVSWRIILEDFISGYKQAERNEEITFPSKSDSFLSWAVKLYEFAESKDLLKELDFWKHLEEKNFASIFTDNDVEIDKKINKNKKSISIRFSKEQTTKLLQKVNWVYNTEINDILLTALAISIRQWGNMKDILINVETHGREQFASGINVDRTVGWFTSQYPLLLELGNSNDLGVLIKSVKETLRKIPNKGLGYGILKYLTSLEQKGEMIFKVTPQIGFNYLGEFKLYQEDPNAVRSNKSLNLSNDTYDSSSKITISKFSKGDSLSQEWPMLHPLELSGNVLDGRLIFEFDYNIYEYNQTTVERLAKFFYSAVEEIIDHCCSKKEKEITPSDVGDSDLTIEELMDIQEMIS